MKYHNYAMFWGSFLRFCLRPVDSLARL